MAAFKAAARRTAPGLPPAHQRRDAGFPDSVLHHSLTAFALERVKPTILGSFSFPKDRSLYKVNFFNVAVGTVLMDVSGVMLMGRHVYKDTLPRLSVLENLIYKARRTACFQ